MNQRIMRDTPGFSLLEILVTLGILIALAGFLVPTLRSAMFRAESANCLGNLRSLGVALNAYLTDHEMRMPEMAAARASKTEEAPVLDTVLGAYAGDPRVFTCPADRSVSEQTGTSYFYNSALSGQAVAALNFLGVSDSPTRIPVLVDKEGWHKHSENRVNHLFADGHAGSEFRLFAE